MDKKKNDFSVEEKQAVRMAILFFDSINSRGNRILESHKHLVSAHKKLGGTAFEEKAEKFRDNYTIFNSIFLEPGELSDLEKIEAQKAVENASETEKIKTNV